MKCLVRCKHSRSSCIDKMNQSLALRRQLGKAKRLQAILRRTRPNQHSQQFAVHWKWISNQKTAASNSECVNNYQSVNCVPERNGFSCFNATGEFKDSRGRKGPAATTIALVLDRLHAGVIVVIHLKESTQ